MVKIRNYTIQLHVVYLKGWLRKVVQKGDTRTDNQSTLQYNLTDPGHNP